jgi:hypothetical protein
MAALTELQTYGEPFNQRIIDPITGASMISEYRIQVTKIQAKLRSENL